MKKVVAIALTIFLLFSLVSCGDTEPEVEVSSDDETVSEITAASPREDIVEYNKSIDPDKIELVQLQPPKTGDNIVTVSTSLGNIYIVLYPQYAPLAADNFIALIEQNFYDGAEFHRIIENFTIESGAPSGSKDKSVYLDENNNSIPFETETHLNLWNFRGALVMRNKGTNHPDTNTSEFFIVQSKIIGEDWFEKMDDIGFPDKVIDVYKEIGGIPGYDGRYTVFGQVFAGLEVLDDIAATPVDSLHIPEEHIWILDIKNEIYDETIHAKLLEPDDDSADNFEDDENSKDPTLGVSGVSKL